MNKIVEDVSILTGVSENTLKKFIRLSNYSIAHFVYENQCSKNNITEIDLGIGELYIKVENNQIKYRFEPSNDLEKMLISTVATKTSPIANKIETNLQDKIERAYKELL